MSKNLVQNIDLSDEDLNLITQETLVRKFVKGECIFKEGSPSGSFFIIKEGTISITKKSHSGVDSNITELKKGFIVGEMSFFKEDSIRSATVVAIDDVTLLEVQSKNADAILKRSPELGAKIYRAIILDLSDKLKVTTENLVVLIQSSRMTALGEMTSGIAHEIGNPLSIIVLAAESIKRDLKLDITDKEKEKFLKKIQTIIGNTLKIGKIVKAVNTIMREGTFDEKESVKLDDIFSEILVLCNERVKNSNIQITFENPNPDLSVLCSSAQIAQVLINLLNNSCDAIVNEEVRWIQIQVREKSTSIEIRITDCGKGLSADMIANLFRPFFTSKPPGKGTGIGLNVSRRILKAHGGNLEYDASCANTCFLMTLPR